jgi:hypothetical protein
MKNTAIVLSVLFVTFSCDNISKGSKKDTVTKTSKDSVIMTNTTVKWQELSSGRECTIETAATLVISDGKQLDSLWAKAFSGYDEPAKPVVDFSKNSVVALFLGVVKSGGHSISITSLQMENTGVKIGAEHKLPGKSCITSTAIEYPFYIALTDPAIKGAPSFTISKKEYECE